MALQRRETPCFFPENHSVQRPADDWGSVWLGLQLSFVPNSVMVSFLYKESFFQLQIFLLLIFRLPKTGALSHRATGGKMQSRKPAMVSASFFVKMGPKWVIRNRVHWLEEDTNEDPAFFSGLLDFGATVSFLLNCWLVLTNLDHCG